MCIKASKNIAKNRSRQNHLAFLALMLHHVVNLKRSTININKYYCGIHARKIIMRCCVFPGQGVQVIGMGKPLHDAFPCAKSVFEEVNEAMGFSLSSLMFYGNQETLNLTQHAQPAIMAVSMAIAKTLEISFSTPITKVARFFAGHSLGEYSALCASGVFSIATTARLLRTRGKAMQEAVAIGTGSMVAILGLSIARIEECIRDACIDVSHCAIANDNTEGQVIVSGYRNAVARVVVLAKKAGAKRAIPLSVSAPFHCPLMQPAARVMQEALENVVMSEPVVPIITNVTARAVTHVETLRKDLIRQVCGCVRWRESLQFMKDNAIDTLLEIGHGRVLSGMAKRINGLDAVPINTIESMEKLAKDLQ